MLNFKLCPDSPKTPKALDLPWDCLKSLTYGDIVLWNPSKSDKPAAFLMVNVYPLLPSDKKGVGLARIAPDDPRVFVVPFDTMVQRIGRLSLTQEDLDGLVRQALVDYNAGA